MRVVLDTNVVIAIRSARHPFHEILTRWLHGEFRWVASTEILLEYAEVLSNLAGRDHWLTLERLLLISPSNRACGPNFSIPGDSIR